MSLAAPGGPVLARYRALLASGELRPDAGQAEAATRLDALAGALARPRAGLLRRLLGARPAAAPGGLYLWGGVGRGKSMLMDLFFAEAPVRPRRRVHFHEFMAETHARLHAARARGAADPLRTAAAQWRAEARLLALDELQVTDPADAMILSRLFEALLDGGVSVVATSNRPPRDLYAGGLNRELFLPFVDLLETRLEVVALPGPTDYRRLRMGGLPVYHVPNGPEATAAMRALFFRLTDFPVEDARHVPEAILELGGGRTLRVPKALKGVAVFSFRRLIDAPHGASDFLAIARRFHTVFLVGVPVMGQEMRNQAARFRDFIDALYDYRCKLVIAADAEPAGLYTGRDGAFEFARTASRLHEMCTAEWMALGHGTRAP